MTETKKQAVVKRLNALSSKAGRLTPEIVVSDAADPKSVLHSCFEWDDTKAAHAHRLDQARGLIRIRMMYVVEEVEVSAPVFVRTPNIPAHAQGYTSVVKLQSNKDSARAALLIEIGRVMSALERARNVALVLGLGAEFNDMIRATTRMQSAVTVSDQPQDDAS